MKTPKKLLAFYDGKVVDMAYAMAAVAPKRAFSVACMRVTDNTREGYVIEDGKVYRVSRAFRSAKIVTGDDRERVLADVAKLQEA